MSKRTEIVVQEMEADPTATAPETTATTAEAQVEPTPEVAPEPEPSEPESHSAPIVADPRDAIFRAYDIRGIVGVTLTKELVYDIGKALGTEASAMNCRTVVVGRDGRLSSPSLSEALVLGIASTGCDVLDIGMVPTPVLYFVVQHTDGRTGIMITGSHNPAEYNGLKIVLKGDALSGEGIQALKRLFMRKRFWKGRVQ